MQPPEQKVRPPRAMHSMEREEIILDLLATRGFVSFRELESALDGSAATIRRDLERLSRAQKLMRVRGGAQAVAKRAVAPEPSPHLAGVPYEVNIKLHLKEKQAIGNRAAAFCKPGEAIMMDGGTTTQQMCPHLAGLNLQVLTNTLYIVSELIAQAGTRVLVPSGTVFPEQRIILSAFGEDGMPQFHAPKLFMGAGSLGPQGLMQADIVLVAAERRLIDRADEVFVLADSSKFNHSSGNVVCELDNIHTVITDDKISDQSAAVLERAGVRLVVVEVADDDA